VSSFRAIVAGEVPDGSRIVVDAKNGELVVQVEETENTASQE